MSEVKVHRVRHRLATKLKTGANLSVATALGSAKDRVQKLEPKIVAVAETEIAQLEALLERMKQGDRVALSLIYQTSDRLVGLAAAAPRLEGFAKAALSLCDVVDGLKGVAPSDTRSIELHISALRTLIAPAAQEREQQAVLAGLAQLRAHFKARESASKAAGEA